MYVTLSSPKHHSRLQQSLYHSVIDAIELSLLLRTPQQRLWMGRKTRKLHLPQIAISTPSNAWFLGPTWVSPQTASRSVQPFMQGLSVWPSHTDRHTGTQTALHATSVAEGRIYAVHAMQPKIHNYTPEYTSAITCTLCCTDRKERKSWIVNFIVVSNELQLYTTPLMGWYCILFSEEGLWVDFPTRQGLSLLYKIQHTIADSRLRPGALT